MSARLPFVADALQGPRTRTGTAERRHAFVQAYLSNGHNAAQAAVSAGYSRKTARSQGQRLLTKVDIQRELAAVAKNTAEAAEISITDALREAKAIIQSDLRAYYDDKGEIKPVKDWTAAMAAAVASVEIDNQYSGTGKNRRLVSTSAKLRFWDKNAALGHVMRHLGMFEKDSVQKMPNLNVQLLLVGPPE